MPVLLIVVNLESDKAYWVSIRDYFQSQEARPSLKVKFDKTKDEFTTESYSDLLRLSRDYASGLYLGPLPKSEILYSNLLQIESLPKRLWIAPTEYRHPGEIWAKFKESGRRIGGDWLLHEKSIISFQDLTMSPWNELCDQGACEDFDVWEWAYSTDIDKRRQFVDLLNRTLRDQLYPEVQYWGRLECFAFTGKPENTPLPRSYLSLKNKSSLTVVSKYTKKNKDGIEFIHLRHLAFRGKFQLFEDKWYLEITPTYVFTWDGFQLDRFHVSRLSKIKQIEGNRAVLSSLLCWADTLQKGDDLYRSIPKIRFGGLATVNTTLGIDDKGWLKGEPDPELDQEDLYDDLLTSIDDSEFQ